MEGINFSIRMSMIISPERKAFVFLCMGLIFTIALGVMSFVSTKNSIEAIKMEKHTFEVISKIKRVSLDINTMQGEVRGYLITGEEGLLEYYRSAVLDYTNSIGELELLIHDKEQRDRIEVIKKLAAERISRLEETIGQKKKGILATSLVSKGEKINVEINALIDDMLGKERAALDLRQTGQGLRIQKALWLIAATTTSGVLLIVAATVLIARDNARRKKLETALRNSTMALEDLYNNAPCGYHSIDGDGLFVRINDTALKWLGYSREEVVGKLHVADILTQQSLESFHENFAKFKESGAVRDLELEFMSKDGVIIPVLLNATAVRDDNGRFRQSRSTFIDVTEARKARHELLEKNRELNDALTKVKLLSGLLPICASCKNIRDDDGYWNSVEKYIGEHSEAAFTHSICPDCARRLYPEFFDK